MKAQLTDAKQCSEISQAVFSRSVDADSVERQVPYANLVCWVISAACGSATCEDAADPPCPTVCPQSSDVTTVTLYSLHHEVRLIAQVKADTTALQNRLEGALSSIQALEAKLAGVKQEASSDAAAMQVSHWQVST